MEMEYLSHDGNIRASLLGPHEFTEYNRHATALEAARSRNPDRWGRISGTLVIVLLAIIVASAIVFGITWQREVTRERLKQEDINALWQSYEEFVAEIGMIPRECECEGVNVTFPVEFADDEFALFDPDEPSRIMVFDLEQLSVGVNSPQSLFVQNSNGVVAYLSDIPEFPKTFTDDVFSVFSKNDASTRIVFDLSGAQSGNPTILRFQNGDGTVALLDDIEDPTDTTTFPQNQFEIRNAEDQTKKITFDVDTLVGIGSTSVVSIPDGEGVIAYLADFVRSEVFPDVDFLVFGSVDPLKTVRFDAMAAVSGIPTVMTIQDRSGTIAYQDQVLEFIDVDITEDRSFPDPDYEGAASLQELGVVQLKITMCGGGGNGRMVRDGDVRDSGGGGGAGGGFRDLFISNPADKYTHLNITIGAGGVGSVTTPCVAGGTTVVSAATLSPGTEPPLVLEGYGGACGGFPDSNDPSTTAAYGGCGGGSGGSPPGDREPGPAGDR